MLPTNRIVVASLIASFAVMIGVRATGPQRTATQGDGGGAAQVPTFSSGIDLVSVDVIVMDRSGRPIANLAAEDFEVSESGRRQKIETFKLIGEIGARSLDGSQPSVASREDASPGVFAIFADDYHVKRASALRMRGQLATLVESYLSASDLVGIMTPQDSIGAFDLSADHSQVARRLQAFEGRKHDYFPKTSAEGQCVGPLLANLKVEEIEQMRNRISLEAIRSLILRLSAVKDTRKVLILFSEGYSARLPVEMRTYAGGLGAGRVATAVPVPSQCGHAQPPEELAHEIGDVAIFAAQHNVAIFAVDPRGLAASEFGMDLPDVAAGSDREQLASTREGLLTLATDSGGRAIMNRNDLSADLERLVSESRVYYLIGYRSEPQNYDGKFHSIKVAVKGNDLTVRHRSGYWATREERGSRNDNAGTATTPSTGLSNAFERIATREGRAVDIWTGVYPDDDGGTSILFAWDRATSSSIAGATPADAVSVVALGRDDTSIFRGRVPARDSATSTVSFKAAPGRVVLRIAVESRTGEVLDREVRTIEVPEFDSSHPSMGTPQFVRGRTADQLQQALSVVPVAGRKVSRRERLVLQVPVYGPDGSLVAHLLNRSGGEVAELRAVRPSAGAVWIVEVPVSSVPVGDYAVRVTLRSEGTEVVDFVAFRVSP